MVAWTALYTLTDAQSRVLYLNRWNGKRKLYRNVDDPNNRWNRDHYLFVFALQLVLFSCIAQEFLFGKWM